MAKDGKTEKATPRRRQDARRKGDIAQSKELNNFFHILAFSLLFLFFGEWFVQKMIDFMRLSFYLAENDMEYKDYLLQLIKKAAEILIPIVAVGTVFQFINYFIQVRFLVSWEAIKPNLKKINPANYFKGVFSRKTIIDNIKSLVLFFVVGWIAYSELRSETDVIASAVLLPWEQSLAVIWGIFVAVLKKIILALLVIGVADYLYQKWEYEEKLKMSVQEVRDEMKDQNGNPEVKQRQRRAMIEILKKEAITKVPEATFIATNPTHYAVAVRYKKGEDAVPKVLVKGVDNVALFMKEIAANHQVPIVENPPLARELYNRVGENEFVPEDMYVAVIEILQYLIRTNQITLEG